MTERYYQRDFEELYYIIDSEKISEEEFDEKYLYEGYTAFEDSMSGEEIVKLLNENEQLKSHLDYFERTYEIEERGLDIVAPMCTIGSPTPSRLELFKENEQLKQENQRMTDKLNQLALEFLNYDMVTMGKATEISEMCYYDFLKYRKENGNPMELQL